MVQGNTTVFQAGSKTWQRLCGAGLAAMEMQGLLDHVDLYHGFWKKPFETRPCVRTKFYPLSSWVSYWWCWKGKCELAMETWGCWKCQKMCSICEGELRAPKCSLEIRWCHLVLQMHSVTEFDASPVEFQSSLGTLFLCSSIGLPCRNRVACSMSLKQDNLPLDFTAHSSGVSWVL